MTTADVSSNVAARMDALRWSRGHTLLLLGLGAGWMFDSLEVNLVGSMINPLDEHFHATYVAGQFVFFSWLLGVLVGALFGGMLADRFGRRRLFMLTLLWYAGFTVLTAFAPALWVVVVLRFVTAMGVGAEYSIINAAITEMVPARTRGRAAAFVMVFWPVGAILAGLLAYFLLNTLALSSAVSWRYGFALGGILALAVLFMRRRIPESPRWLLSQGRKSEADQIVKQFEGTGTVTAAAAPLPSTPAIPLKGALRELIRRYPGRVTLGCSLNLAEAFGYYGIFAFLPLIVLPSIDIPDAQIPFFYIMGNIGALAGGITMALVFDRLGRQRTVIGFFTLAAAGVAILALATRTGDGAWVVAGFMASNAMATAAGSSTYPTMTELFPTPLRAAALGLCVAVGRIGAAFGITLVTFTANHAGITTAYLLVAAFWLIGAAVMATYALRGGVEAARRPLEELGTG